MSSNARDIDEEAIAIVDIIGTKGRLDEPFEDRVIDPIVLKIIACTVNKPRTVREISSFIKAPSHKCYEIMSWMVEEGLLVKVGRKRTSGNNRATLYIATVVSGTIEFSGERIAVKWKYKNGQGRGCEETFHESRCNQVRPIKVT